jgi:hypothetical protein
MFGMIFFYWQGCQLLKITLDNEDAECSLQDVRDFLDGRS